MKGELTRTESKERMAPARHNVCLDYQLLETVNCCNSPSFSALFHPFYSITNKEQYTMEIAIKRVPGYHSLGTAIPLRFPVCSTHYTQ